MKTKRNIKTLVREQAGKEAVVILNMVEKMLKQGVARARIEKALAKKLSACAKMKMRNIEQIYYGAVK
jgi:hypothetical protein